MLELVFLIVSILLFLNILLGKMFVFGRTNSIAISKCGVLMGMLFLFYSLSAFSFVIFDSVLTHKVIMFLLGLSPFIIGKLTTYKTINVYSIIQLFVILSGLIFGVIIS